MLLVTSLVHSVCVCVSMCVCAWQVTLFTILSLSHGCEICSVVRCESSRPRPANTMQHCTHKAQHAGATNKIRREEEGERDRDREIERDGQKD